jgi:hypothetical protein
VEVPFLSKAFELEVALEATNIADVCRNSRLLEELLRGFIISSAAE